MKEAYGLSDTRKLNALKRLIKEQGAAQASKVFAEALRKSDDSMGETISSHLLMGVTRAEAEASEDVR